MLASISSPLADPVRPWELHTPDGFLTLPVSLAMWAITVGMLVLAVRFTNRAIDERMVPLLGVTAAFIFAAQMVNFPVYPGTSGHLLGGVLAAILVGPWAGTLVMACVIGVQALVFTDGGLVVMGANIFNMGIVGTLGGFAVYAAVTRVLGGEQRGRLPAAAIAAWLAVMGGALGIALQLGLSGATDLGVALPVILGIHALIGLGEAAITVAALAFIGAVRGELLHLRHAAGASR
ncbi:MAG TPA: energy-coupling factor ABC transporter permease [candidate division Zixibacteria bacterium]|nr:energy-coupling factor ABC transporter permease [candidate division Zixibacteria bacterium]